MREVIDKFSSVLENPYEAMKESKETQGKKAIGCAPMHFPEEIVYAAGVLPLLLQESAEPVTTGYGYIYPFYCGFVRSLIDLAVKGKLDFLDGLIFPDTCLQMRGTFGILQIELPPRYLEFVQMPPYLREASAFAEMMESYQRLRVALEDYTGRRITQESLREAIALYNWDRALLRKLYELRKANPGVLRSQDILAIVLSSMVMPKAEHGKLLEKLLSELEKQPVSDQRPRVIVSGHLCQAPKPDLLDMIEDLGAVIVNDDLYTGYRYFAIDAATSGDPWEALVRRYLSLPFPCASRSMPARGEDDWGEYLIRMARRDKAQGIILLMVKFCEPHIMYYPYIKEVLTTAGVPHLLIETEHEVVSLGGVKTRIQAFVEMLREKGRR